MRRWYPLVLLLLLYAPAPWPAIAGETLPPDDRLRSGTTSPGHVRTPPYDPDPPPAIAPARPPFERRGRIVYAFDRPARSLLEPAPELSVLCRQGRFNQRIDMLYRGFGPGERPLGIAYGRMAINLIDPDGRRDAETVYFFDKHETSRCTVFTGQVTRLGEWFVPP